MDQITDWWKNQTICTTNFKEKTRGKSIDFVIKPWLILVKHKQLCTIVTMCCYHQSMLLRVSFLKAIVLKKFTSFPKFSNLLFILVLKREDDWISFSVLSTGSFHITGHLMEIRNLHLRNLICGFL